MYHRHPWEASVDAVRAAVLSEDRSGYVWLETQSADPYGSFSWLAAGAPQMWHRPEHPSGAATLHDWNALVAAWRAQPTWWLGMLSYDLKSVFEPTVPQPQNRRPEEPDFLFLNPAGWRTPMPKARGWSSIRTSPARSLTRGGPTAGILLRQSQSTVPQPPQRASSLR